MEVMTRDQLWKCILRNEPTKAKRHRRYLWGGILYYFVVFLSDPRRALKEIAGAAFCIAALIALCYLPRIAVWIQGGAEVSAK